MKQKWIADIISIEDVKSWGNGDVITIKAGTGKGKSYFIKNTLCQYAKRHNKRILLMVHRIDCLQQFKMDIVGMGDTITILTYQSIDKIYENDGFFNFDDYDYIVCDEFHYFTSDASFNNTTDMSINAILEHHEKVKIFMSATAGLMHKYLNNYREITTIDYAIEIDFNFINELYFYEDDDTEESIIENILNNSEKVIVFINHLKELEKLYLKYREKALFNCAETAKQYKYVDPDKINDMLRNSQFTEQILFTTSVMDTGVSIKDKSVKHIICNNIADINILIQSIGRKRIVDKNDKINIYVKNISNNVLGGYLRQARLRIEKVKYLQEHGQYNYVSKYKKVPEDKSIVYFDVEEEKIVAKINDMAYFKTLVDILELESMLKIDYKYYVARALDKHSQYKTIETIIEKQTLEKYLDSIVGNVMLMAKDRKGIIEKMNVMSNGKQLKSLDSLNSALREQEIKFYIDQFETSRMINGKKKNFKSAWRVLRLVDK